MSSSGRLGGAGAIGPATDVEARSLTTHGGNVVVRNAADTAAVLTVDSATGAVNAAGAAAAQSVVLSEHGTVLSYDDATEEVRAGALPSNRIRFGAVAATAGFFGQAPVTRRSVPTGDPGAAPAVYSQSYENSLRTRLNEVVTGLRDLGLYT